MRKLKLGPLADDKPVKSQLSSCRRPFTATSSLMQII